MLLSDRSSQKRLEPLGVMAASVAHEINDYLTVLVNGAAISLERIEPDHPAAGELRDIELAARRCAALTERLLSFSCAVSRHLPSVRLEVLLTEAESRLSR